MFNASAQNQMEVIMITEVESKNILHKLLFILILVLLFLFALSCNNQDSSTNAPVNGKKNEQVPNSPESSKENGVDEKEEVVTDSKNIDPTEEKLAQTDKKTAENTANAVKGKEVYESKGCSACHTFVKGKLVGPDLLGVTKKREEDWLRRWMKDPDGMLKSDPIAKEMLKEFLVPMPNQGLNDEEVDAIISYLKEEDSKQ